MSTFDMKEGWQEGFIFMKQSEFDELAIVYGDYLVAKCLQISCNIADNAIKKAMREL